MTGSPNKAHQWLTLDRLFPLVVLNGWLALQVLNIFNLLLPFCLSRSVGFHFELPSSVSSKRQVKRKLRSSIGFLLTLVIFWLLWYHLIPLLLEQLSSAKPRPSGLILAAKNSRLLMIGPRRRFTC